MFDKAFDTINQAIEDRVSGVTVTRDHPVPIVYGDVSDNEQRLWEHKFDEWLPILDDAGWLDGLTRIEVGNEFVSTNGLAEYRYADKTVSTEARPNPLSEKIVDDSWEAMLIHETTHHVHMNEIWNERGGIPDRVAEQKENELGWNEGTSRLFSQCVSRYSSKTFLEAVAETCTGVVLGHTYPKPVKEAYYDLMGPEPFTDWDTQTRTFKSVKA